MKKIAIMQPYFLPYIGYWQLINAVDEFVVYDNIQYTKKGWINRNKYLLNGNEKTFSLSLKASSSKSTIIEKHMAVDFNRKKLLNQIAEAYRGAPHFEENFQLIQEIILFDDNNLFNYILNSILKICCQLEISTKIIISSALEVEHQRLRAQDKVIAICKALTATHYLNTSGGLSLYDKTVFSQEHLELSFIKSLPILYTQFKDIFVPNLSIIDVLMFNSSIEIKKFLVAYTLS